MIPWYMLLQMLLKILQKSAGNLKQGNINKQQARKTTV